uniref:Domain of unknown function DB domain-containing protein n=1 Tax=Syphacia muris TaxID=451379 RepID=A0A0N5AR53_9BILA
MNLCLKYNIAIIQLLLIFELQTVIAVKCYEGRQYDDNGVWIDTVQLESCSKFKQCCSALSSVNGRTFACSEYCPQPTLLSCGPDPSWNMTNLFYCYCKSYLNRRCHPSTFSSKKLQSPRALI